MFPSSNHDNLNPFLPLTINHNYNDSLLQMLTAPSFFLPSSEPRFTPNNRSTLIGNTTAGKKASKKPSLKKERHSKIRTAQGLRDRRVRLSVGIARRFFDLQDALGFDKASKTLEWLLAKSKGSILELVKTKNLCPTSNTSRTGEDQAVGTTSPRKNKMGKCAFYKLDKESRQKARERARERTRANMYDKSLAHQVQEIPNFQNTPLEPTKSSDQQSVLAKTNFGYHQSIDTTTTTTTKDVGSINCNNYIPHYLPQTLYPMMDTNLSTELHAHGNLLEIIQNNTSQDLQ